MWIAALLVASVATGAAVWVLKPAPEAADARVTRVTVTLPAGDRVQGSGTGTYGNWAPLAISPDGTQLAYVSGGYLYLRAMDDLQSKRMSGTEGAWSPFFSPDSQWVGFFAQGQLKKMSVRGGTIVPLCDAAVPAGATWGSDGFVYFAPTNNAGLSKVAEVGGQPEPVTTLDRGLGEISHRFPQALPAGRGLLISVWRGPGHDECDVQWLDLRTGERTVLIVGGDSGRYVPSGHIVYARAEELMAVRFDSVSLKVGPPAPVGLKVRYEETSNFAVSATGTLAYVPGGFAAERRLVWVDRDGRVEPFPSSVPLREYAAAAISADGLRAALTVVGPAWGVWIHSLARHDQTPLTPSATGSSQWAQWSPDGRVLYRGTRRGFRNVYVKSADGTGGEAQVTTGERLQTPTSVSPDGKWLAYLETAPGTGDDAWVRPLDRDGPAQVVANSSGGEDFVKFSPTGRWLAYQSNESGRDETYLVPFPPEPGRRVTVSTRGGSNPEWSRDGRSLFYISDGAMMMVDVSNAPNVGTPRRLFALGNLLERYAVARDGRFLMIQSAEPPEAGTQIQIVLNFFEELRRRVR